MGRCRSRWQCCGRRRCFQRQRERDQRDVIVLIFFFIYLLFFGFPFSSVLPFFCSLFFFSGCASTTGNSQCWWQWQTQGSCLAGGSSSFLSIFCISPSFGFYSYASIFLSSFSLFPPFSSSFMSVFIEKQIWGERSTTPVQPWHRGRGWEATRQPPQGHPQGLFPLLVLFGAK